MLELPIIDLYRLLFQQIRLIFGEEAKLDDFFGVSFNIYKSFWLFRYLLKIVLKNEKACIVDNIPNFYLKKKIKSPIFLAQATAKTLSAIFLPLFHTTLRVVLDRLATPQLSV